MFEKILFMKCVLVLFFEKITIVFFPESCSACSYVMLLVLVGLVTGYTAIGWLIFNHEIIDFMTRINILGFVTGSSKIIFI